MKYIFDEVNAVDKYDYKVKTEEMLELMEDGAYRQAAEIADEIDWKRVRNTGMLADVSEIYEKNKEYQKAYEVLNLAYRRAEEQEDHQPPLYPGGQDRECGRSY